MTTNKENTILTKEEAKSMLLVNEDGTVHTFHNMPFGLLGGDNSKHSVENAIDKAFMLKRSGDIATKMGHGLVIIPKNECKQSDLQFIATVNNEEKL